MARDTPGRDAYQARARQARKGSLRDLQVQVPAGPNWLSSAAKSLGVHPRQQIPAAKQLASDVAWTATHPVDRLMGRGRAQNQQMQWVGPNKLFPAGRIPTENPNWEIIRNKGGMGNVARDLVVGLSGRREYYDIPRGLGVARERRNLRQREQEVAGMQARGEVSPISAEAQLAIYNGALRRAILERRDEGLDLMFSAVPTGTRQPHASLGMKVKPDETYVDFLAALEQVLPYESRQAVSPPRGADYAPLPLPPKVLLQLMSMATMPEKPVSAWVVNPRLEQFLNKMVQEKGLEFRSQRPDFSQYR